MSKPLSPAALDIDDAAHSQPSSPRAIAAAALRAATDHGEYMVDPVDGKTAVVRVADLEAWATELEGPNA